MSEASPRELTIDRDRAGRMMDALTNLVARAGAAILEIRRGGTTVAGKTDGSPVTAADLAADKIIADGLSTLIPEVPTLSEERSHLAKFPYRGSFFLIDPLDGTKEFIAGHDEFTVNVALMTNGTPLLGIVGAPALGLIWRGLVGYRAERLMLNQDLSVANSQTIHTRRYPGCGEPWIATVSRSHGDARTEAFIESRPGAVRRVLGSAVKFCRVADGEADIYPRLSPTCEWDVAAGHAVLAAAGGKITDTSGAALRFGTGLTGFIVPEFIAWGDPTKAP